MDLEDLGPRLDRASERVGPEVARTVRRQGTLLRGLIRANASGRPGPNIVTGMYWKSWRGVDRQIPHGGETEVGTDRPYGRRLEFGFFDMYDSLGRHFYQVPRPHVGPAVARLSQTYEDAFKRALDDIFGGA